MSRKKFNWSVKFVCLSRDLRAASRIGTAMRYEGLVGGVSPDAGKPPREEVATPVPIAGDVEGTGTGSIRASCALAGNQLVRLDP